MKDGRKAPPGFSADPMRSAALPGYLYSDPAVFEAEKARLFFGSWQPIAHVSELARTGDYVTATIVDQSVFAMRGADGALRAFYNVCQHRAHELLKGKGNVKAAIVCPYHAWSYELDGGLRSARATRNLPDFDPADYKLAPLRLETHLGLVFVNLDQRAPSLGDIAGDMFADMAHALPWLGDATVNPNYGFTAESAVPLPANWKILAENCLECYHCAPAHRAYVDLIDVGQYVLEQHGVWMKSAAPLRNRENTAYHVSPDEPIQHSTFWHLFPNIEFGIMPGSRALSVFSFTPLGPEETRIAWFMLTLPGESLASERLNYVGAVLWPEDAAICESVHRGLKSLGYRQGGGGAPPSPPTISEINVHAFQRRYADAMALSI